ncbi:MAG TPA: thiamine phosphate synthase [Spirochaetota bacterium]|nr:thiamine phosphate synthase [Spirochaetota bacterium]
MRGYYFITDSGLSRAGNIPDLKAALSAGVTVVQYREKNKSTAEMYSEALELRNLCRGSGALFIINDRIDISLAVDADGVHLGQGDMPYRVARSLLGSGKVIGISVSTVNEAVEAESSGADYLGVGPVFATSTKTDAAAPCGLELVSVIRKRCTIPMVAIGGINEYNAAEVVAAGADMVCSISDVVTHADVAERIRIFSRHFDMPAL